jgi:uncharacterized protein YqfA (UPF0365 family)
MIASLEYYFLILLFSFMIIQSWVSALARKYCYVSWWHLLSTILLRYVCLVQIPTLEVYRELANLQYGM